MAASMTALGTVIWSDFAQASEVMQVELADDVIAPSPVKLAKIEHKPVDFEIPEPTKMPMKRKRRLDFGSFEGY